MMEACHRFSNFCDVNGGQVINIRHAEEAFSEEISYEVSIPKYFLFAFRDGSAVIISNLEDGVGMDTLTHKEMTNLLYAAYEEGFVRQEVLELLKSDLVGDVDARQVFLEGAGKSVLKYVRSKI